MDALLASSLGVSSGQPVGANTSALLAAIAAAANDQTLLHLPAGDLLFDQDLVLPAGFIGAGGIVGLGRKITRLVPQGGCNGLLIDLSAQKPANNTWDLAGFGLVAPLPVAGSVVAAGIALRISYGTAGLGSIENQPGSSVRDVAVYGGGWIHGAVFQECWHLLVENLYLFGNESTYTAASAVGKGDGGAGSGIALLFMSGVNNHLKGLCECEFFSQGLVTNANGRGAAGDCQGLMIDDLSMVECVEPVHAYGTPAGNLSTIIISSLMLDNGNLDVANHRGIVLDNAEDCEIGEGQILQNGGDSCIIFNSCKNCSVSDDMSLENRANTTGPTVQDNNGTNNYMGQGASKLLNVSTRGFVGTGASILIAGFVIGGTVPKTVLVRATGPGLAEFGVAGVLVDPQLQLLSGATLVAKNVGWGGAGPIAAAAAKVGAFSWSASSRDSAILATLQPGSYTAQVTGDVGDTGVALVEVYTVPST